MEKKEKMIRNLFFFSMRVGLVLCSGHTSRFRLSGGFDGERRGGENS